MFHNIVIGKPLIEPWKLISNSEEEFEKAHQACEKIAEKLKELTKDES